MNQRIAYQKLAPDGMRALYGVEKYVQGCGLEHGLLEMVKLRASQLNGCAYCVDLHSKNLHNAGEREERIFALPVWEESPFYTDRERAALAWTEAVTNIQDGHVPDGVFNEARRHFGEKELVDLTMAVVAINSWNRLAITFRKPGVYQPAPPATVEV